MSACVRDGVGGEEAAAGGLDVGVVCGVAAAAAVPEGAAGEAVGRKGLRDVDPVPVPPKSEAEEGTDCEAVALAGRDTKGEALALPLTETVRSGEADAPPRGLPLALRDGEIEGAKLLEGWGVQGVEPLRVAAPLGAPVAVVLGVPLTLGVSV